MTDMIGSSPQLENLVVGNCNQAFDFVNSSGWTERITAINVTDQFNNHFFHYDQNPGDTNNSYGYGSYLGIYINKHANQDVFYLTGGAYLYHSTFVIKGNLMVIQLHKGHPYSTFKERRDSPVLPRPGISMTLALKQKEVPPIP